MNTPEASQPAGNDPIELIRNAVGALDEASKMITRTEGAETKERIGDVVIDIGAQLSELSSMVEGLSKPPSPNVPEDQAKVLTRLLNYAMEAKRRMAFLIADQKTHDLLEECQKTILANEAKAKSIKDDANARYQEIEDELSKHVSDEADDEEAMSIDEVIALIKEYRDTADSEPKRAVAHAYHEKFRIAKALDTEAESLKFANREIIHAFERMIQAFEMIILAHTQENEK